MVRGTSTRAADAARRHGARSATPSPSPVQPAPGMMGGETDMSDDDADELLDFTLEPPDDRWRLEVEVVLPCGPREAWTAITEADIVSRWAPYSPSRDLTHRAPVELDYVGADLPPVDGVVADVIPGARLVLLWGPDRLSFRLTPADGATRLHLVHRLADADQAADVAAGWHLCLRALREVVQGHDVAPVTGEAALAAGWERLRDAYSGRLRAAR